MTNQELQILLETADEKTIHDVLVKESVKGKKHIPYHCPIAHLIEKYGNKWPYIYQDKITWVTAAANGKSKIVLIPSAGVASFIQNFEWGMYPELEEA